MIQERPKICPIIYRFVPKGAANSFFKQNNDFWTNLSCSRTVWPDWAIYCTLGNFSKPVATIIVPKLSTFRAIFCKGVNISHFSNEIIFGQLLQTFGNLILVTLQLQQPVFTSFCVNGDSNGGGLRSRWWGQANMTANHIIWENKLNLRRIGFK